MSAIKNTHLFYIVISLLSVLFILSIRENFVEHSKRNISDSIKNPSRKLTHYIESSTKNISHNRLDGFSEDTTKRVDTMGEILEGSKIVNKSLPVLLTTVGGMGNQLFQYAAAYALSQKRNSDLYICHNYTGEAIREFMIRDAVREPSKDRSFALEYFQIPREHFHDKCGPLLKSPYNADELQVANFEEFPKNKYIQMAGYFESEIFFRDYKEELLNYIRLKNGILSQIKNETFNIFNEINNSDSVAVHVRKGDFNLERYTYLPFSYYRRAIDLMTEKLLNKSIVENRGGKVKVKFFVFSDDIEGIKLAFSKTFKDKSLNVVFVSNSNFSRWHDFFLMMSCKNIIIANSTFSWWAAYLNEHSDKIVIAPTPKFGPDFYKHFSKGTHRFYRKIYGGVWSYPYSWFTINTYN